MPTWVQSWEYTICHIYATDTGLKSRLNKMGEENWELTAATPGDSEGETLYIFKRPVMKEKKRA